MITTEGTLHVKRYMAGYVPSIALSMAFGVGESEESLDSTSLDFEVGRSDVDIIGYDFEQDKLIFKATLDEGFDATLYEVALYSLPANIQSGEFGSRLLSSFDSETEFWTQAGSPATYTTENTRIGLDSVQVSPAASGSITVSQNDIVMNLSGYSAADEFAFAFYCNNGNASTIRLRLKTDNSNYYDITIPSASITSGFNIVRIPKGAAVATGAPAWEFITGMDVAVNAKSSGSVTVNLEGIRIEDMDTVAPDYVLVARSKLALPFEKFAGRTQEIEFPIGVTVNAS